MALAVNSQLKLAAINLFRRLGGKPRITILDQMGRAWWDAAHSGRKMLCWRMTEEALRAMRHAAGKPVEWSGDDHRLDGLPIELIPGDDVRWHLVTEPNVDPRASVP